MPDRTAIQARMHSPGLSHDSQSGMARNGPGRGKAAIAGASHAVPWRSCFVRSTGNGTRGLV